MQVFQALFCWFSVIYVCVGFSPVMWGFLGTDSQELNQKKHDFLLPLVTPATAAEALTNFFPFLSQFWEKKKKA